MKEIILVGAGGHAAVILDILKAQIAKGEKIKFKGFLDDSNKKQWMGYPVLGSTLNINHFNEENTYFILAIGSNKIRYKLIQKYKHLKFYTAIHPSAIIGSQVEIGDGTVVMPNAVINANSQIGQHVIINTGAIVEHDNLIEHCAHVASNATLCGGARVKALTHIKSGVTVVQGITVGSQSIIEAGSTVMNDLPNQVIASGSLAQIIKSINLEEETR